MREHGVVMRKLYPNVSWLYAGL